MRYPPPEAWALLVIALSSLVNEKSVWPFKNVICHFCTLEMVLRRHIAHA
jgi:hypothetical protein